MKQQTQATALALLAVLFWSTMATAFTLGLREMDTLQLMLGASCVSLLCLGFVASATRAISLSDLDGPTLLRAAMRGALNPFAYYVILLKAYTLLPAQEAMALNYTWPMTLVLLSVPLLKQSISWRTVAALLISFTGVLVVATQGNIASLKLTDPLGDALALGSSVIWALYWIANVRDKHNDVAKLFLGMAFGTVYLLVATLLFSELRLPTRAGLGAIVYIGLFETGITFVCWLKALSRSTSAARVGQLIYLSPFLSMLFIRMVLKESIHPATAVGVILIVGGIVVQQRLQKSREAIKPQRS